MSGVVKKANSASKHFGDLKYWVTESSDHPARRLPGIGGSRQKQASSPTSCRFPRRSRACRRHQTRSGAMTDLARQAGVAYPSDDSASGNALLDQAKSHVLTIDGEIESVVDRVEQQAVAKRDASTRGAELAVKLAIVGGVGALLLALGFTALRCVDTVPLKQLERSMASITRGDLDPRCRPQAPILSRRWSRRSECARQPDREGTGSSGTRTSPSGDPGRAGRRRGGAA